MVQNNLFLLKTASLGLSYANVSHCIVYPDGLRLPCKANGRMHRNRIVQHVYTYVKSTTYNNNSEGMNELFT